MNPQIKIESNLNQYKMDVYKVDLFTNNNIIDVEISNVISWELMRLKGTKKELKGLAEFILKYLEND